MRVLGGILAAIAAVLAGLGALYAGIAVASHQPASIGEALSSLGYWFEALFLFTAATPFGVLAVFCELVHRHSQPARPPVGAWPPPAPWPGQGRP